VPGAIVHDDDRLPRPGLSDRGLDRVCVPFSAL
jgi:hypothetical protein